MDMDKLVAALPAAGVSVSVERNLRRPQRLLGLRPAGRRAEAEHQRRLVARHGHRPQRAGDAAGRAVDLRNGRPRLHDHHAPAGVEVLGALRLVLRHDGRLPARRRSAIASTRSAAAGSSSQGPASLRHDARRSRRSRKTSSSGRSKLFNLRAKDADEIKWDGDVVSLAKVDDLSQGARLPTPTSSARSPSRANST